MATITNQHKTRNQNISNCEKIETRRLQQILNKQSLPVMQSRKISLLWNEQHFGFLIYIKHFMSLKIQ